AEQICEDAARTALVAGAPGRRSSLISGSHNWFLRDIAPEH
ncbi:jg19651, partial [Pararge aegeria aegeria]